jgi:multicomponent Na+:H+ antiporter subunit C
MELWLLLVVSVLFVLSFYLLLQRSISRVLLGLLALSNAANLLIFTSAGLERGVSPIIVGESLKDQVHADPLPQALILTAIVIGMGILAFSLALSVKIKKVLQIEDVDDLKDE